MRFSTGQMLCAGMLVAILLAVPLRAETFDLQNGATAEFKPINGTPAVVISMPWSDCLPRAQNMGFHHQEAKAYLLVAMSMKLGLTHGEAFTLAGQALLPSGPNGKIGNRYYATYEEPKVISVSASIPSDPSGQSSLDAVAPPRSGSLSDASTFSLNPVEDARAQFSELRASNDVFSRSIFSPIGVAPVCSNPLAQGANAEISVPCAEVAEAQKNVPDGPPDMVPAGPTASEEVQPSLDVVDKESDVSADGAALDDADVGSNDIASATDDTSIGGNEK